MMHRAADTSHGWLNARGLRIAHQPWAIANFWRWYGDSKVVDEEGRPVVVYHGTKADFAEFDPTKMGASDEGLAGKGFYFTYNPAEASSYALRENFGAGDAPNVVAAYVALQNPLVITQGVLPDGRKVQELHGGTFITAKGGAAVRKLAQDGGHDGVMWVGRDGGPRHVVAWKAEQIKSAVGNSGAFDGLTPSLCDTPGSLWTHDQDDQHDDDAPRS